MCLAVYCDFEFLEETICNFGNHIKNDSVSHFGEQDPPL